TSSGTWVKPSTPRGCRVEQARSCSFGRLSRTTTCSAATSRPACRTRHGGLTSHCLPLPRLFDQETSMGYSPFSPRGLVHLDASRAFEGYTLFATLSGDSAYLVDLKGQTVRTWQPRQGLKPFGAELLESGNVFMECADG